MASLIILVLVGGASLAVAATALWRTPATRESLRRAFGRAEGSRVRPAALPRPRPKLAVWRDAVRRGPRHRRS